MRLPRRISAAAAIVALAACAQAPAREDDGDKAGLGLFSTLPLYWGEGDIASVIEADSKPDWVRTRLEASFALTPLDALEAENLAEVDRLLLAQPRPLAPSENVALDSWLRNGGRLLILADPMLTRHSRYPIGDRRRPQDVVLLSPILKRWGLELRFDDAQPEGERWVELGNAAVPVNLAGSFALIEPGAPSRCTLAPQAVLARCTVGKGSVTVLADAAVLDVVDGAMADARRTDAFDALVALALDSGTG